MESCIGCGIVTQGEHPFVGIGHQNLAEGSGPMVQHPVCQPCHQDPAHRSLGPLKVTFFPREHSPVALRAARATDQQSKSGQAIGIGMGVV